MAERDQRERQDPQVAAVEIVPGLLRWTAPHPDWDPQARPGSTADWDQNVGSVLYELPDAVVLIDPLLPSERRPEFLAWLDDRIEARPVSVLTTIRWHRRDREELAERYEATTSRAWNAVPAGVKPRPLRGAGETMFWLPAVEALIAGDRLIGVPGIGLRLCRKAGWAPCTSTVRGWPSCFARSSSCRSSACSSPTVSLCSAAHARRSCERSPRLAAAENRQRRSAITVGRALDRGASPGLRIV